jgi:hypothetical protein
MLEQKIEALTEAVKALTEAMVAAQSQSAPKADTPKADTPKADTPKADTLVNIDMLSAKAVAFSRGKAGMADIIRAKMAELGGETLSKIKPEQLVVFEAWLDEQIGGEK